MKRSIIQKLIKILIPLVLIIFMSQAYSFAAIEKVDTVKVATGIIDPNDYKPEEITGADSIISKGATIINVIRTIGIIVTVVSLMIMGIKYMTGSIGEKADYKKSMIPYLIGVFIFFSLSVILTTIIELVTSIE